MSDNILTVEKAKAFNIEVIENGRGSQAVHDVVVAMRANRRSGTASTKTKAEVAGSGAKPWRQKGTGRARAGYKSSVIWRGGGVVFGPKPRDYSKKVSKSVKRLALLKALSTRIIDGDVLVVDAVKANTPKTKDFISLVEGLTGKVRNVLIVSTDFDETTYLAARNIQSYLLSSATEVNTEDLLRYAKIVVTNDALKGLAERTSK